MAPFSISGLRLSAVCATVPAREVPNADLEMLEGPEGRDFARFVGITSRRVAPPSLCASDLCAAASRHLFDHLDRSPSEIEAVVFVTQTPDYPLPGNSMLLQDRLGLPASSLLLDLNQGCAGYVYGLATLAGMMTAAGLDTGLLLVGDTITRFLSPEDRSTVPLFSDAGSATLVERAPEAESMHFLLGGDGAGASAIQVPGGGCRHPFGPESLTLAAEEESGIRRAPVHLAMRGMDVLHHSLSRVATSVTELLDYAEASVEDPDHYVFHQANQVLNKSLAKRIGVPTGRAPETLVEYGNTSCATIPVTICHRLGEALSDGERLLLLSGFGSGFSWGNALVRTGPLYCPPLLEIEEPDEL